MGGAQPGSVGLRDARRRDAQLLWRLRADAIRSGCRGFYTEAQVHRWAGVGMPGTFEHALEHAPFQVAELDATIGGFGFLDLEANTVAGLFVAPIAFRRGIGRALLHRLEALAVERRIACLHLSASLNAVSFYETCGFRAIQRTKWAHPEGFELDCVAMFKSRLG